MKVRVDRNLCDEHGQCTIAAPKVFQITDDGKLEYDSEPDDALRDEIEEAADVCPVQAIFLDGA
jgi:ferredoxin